MYWNVDQREGQELNATATMEQDGSLAPKTEHTFLLTTYLLASWNRWSRSRAQPLLTPCRFVIVTTKNK